MASKKLRLAHPGRILREEFMEPMDLTAYGLAKALGVPTPRVNDIVRERRAISSEMAVLLAAYFDTTAEFWCNLQGHYDLEMVEGSIARRAAAIRRHRVHDREAARPAA